MWCTPRYVGDTVDNLDEAEREQSDSAEGPMPIVSWQEPDLISHVTRSDATIESGASGTSARN